MLESHNGAKGEIVEEEAPVEPGSQRLGPLPRRGSEAGEKGRAWVVSGARHLQALAQVQDRASIWHALGGHESG